MELPKSLKGSLPLPVVPLGDAGGNRGGDRGGVRGGGGGQVG